MKSFSHDQYARLVERTIEQINSLSKLKGGEYAGDNDRLANFRRNGEVLGLPMETVWAVYYNKHHDAVMQFIQDLNTGKRRDRMEPISGRVDDMIVYLILLKAMLEERDPAELPMERKFEIINAIHAGKSVHLPDTTLDDILDDLHTANR